MKNNKVLGETILYRLLYEYRVEGHFHLYDKMICRILTFITGNRYSLPYFAIRERGIDFSMFTFTPIQVAKWNEIFKVEYSATHFRFLLKSGYEFEIQYSGIDYESVQTIKNSFSAQGLLVSTSSK